MIKLRRLVQEFFEKTLRGDFGQGFTACNPALHPGQNLILSQGIEFGKVPAQPRLGNLIQAVQAKTERLGVQKLDSTCPLPGVFSHQPEINGPRYAEEWFAIRLRNQPRASRRQRTHLMRIQKLAGGTGSRHGHGHSSLAHKRFLAHQM